MASSFSGRFSKEYSKGDNERSSREEGDDIDLSGERRNCPFKPWVQIRTDQILAGSTSLECKKMAETSDFSENRRLSAYSSSSESDYDEAPLKSKSPPHPPKQKSPHRVAGTPHDEHSPGVGHSAEISNYYPSEENQSRHLLPLHDSTDNEASRRSRSPALEEAKGRSRSRSPLSAKVGGSGRRRRSNSRSNSQTKRDRRHRSRSRSVSPRPRNASRSPSSPKRGERRFRRRSRSRSPRDRRRRSPSPRQQHHKRSSSNRTHRRFSPPPPVQQRQRHLSPQSPPRRGGGHRRGGFVRSGRDRAMEAQEKLANRLEWARERMKVSQQEKKHNDLSDLSIPSEEDVGGRTDIKSLLSGCVSTENAVRAQAMALQEKVREETGIEVPKYYNATAVNPVKFAEQEMKRKQLWSHKSETKTLLWSRTNLGASQENNKFRRLMGLNSSEKSSSNKKSGQSSSGGRGRGRGGTEEVSDVMKDLQMQYEQARIITHTQRGVGLGFGLMNNE